MVDVDGSLETNWMEKNMKYKHKLNNQSVGSEVHTNNAIIVN